MLSKEQFLVEMRNLQTQTINDLKMLLGSESSSVQSLDIVQPFYDDKAIVIDRFLAGEVFQFGTVRLSKSYDLGLMFVIAQKNEHTPASSDHYVTVQIDLAINCPRLQTKYLVSPHIQAIQALTDMFQSNNVLTYQIRTRNLLEIQRERVAFQQTMNNSLISVLTYSHIDSYGSTISKDFKTWCKNSTRNKPKAFVLSQRLNVEVVCDQLQRYFNRNTQRISEIDVLSSLEKGVTNGYLHVRWDRDAPSVLWFTRL